MKELRGRGRQFRKLMIIVAVVIAALGIVYHLFFGTGGPFYKAKEKPAEQSFEGEGQDSTAAPQQQLVPIKAFSVAQFDFEDNLNALGQIKGGLEFKLSFEIPGIVAKINYKEGEKYEKNALLMSLNQDDIILRLRRSEARLNKAETSVEIARQKLEEHEKLFEIGAIPQSTLEKARLEFQGAQFEKEETELQVRADEIILEKSNLYAPSGGMIGELNVEEGEAITSNTLLGTHILTEYVRAEFGVIERDLARIERGQQAMVFVDAYPDKSFQGEVDSVSKIVTGTSRTASAEIKVTNSEDLLLPGMFARIKILLYKKNNAIVIPSEAVAQTTEGPGVFVLDEAQEAVDFRFIEIEYSQTDYTVVKKGLEKGELIAISNIENLQPGTQVEVVEKQEL